MLCPKRADGFWLWRHARRQRGAREAVHAGQPQRAVRQRCELQRRRAREGEVVVAGVVAAAAAQDEALRQPGAAQADPRHAHGHLASLRVGTNQLRHGGRFLRACDVVRLTLTFVPLSRSTRTRSGESPSPGGSTVPRRPFRCLVELSRRRHTCSPAGNGGAPPPLLAAASMKLDRDAMRASARTCAERMERACDLAAVRPACDATYGRTTRKS